MLVEHLQELKQGAGDTQAKSENGDQTKTKEDVEEDVVIIYESNVDGSAVALSDDTPKPRPPNQYVETIIYEDEETESECSEISETYTKEDLNELCLINSEALDFINNIPSVDAPLCHKQNKMKIKPSGFMTDYKNPFECTFFNQQNFNSIGSFLSTSLMDILCSNQKNDNYVCYMDNLISHVQYTIEELKRISNGEYLTDRTKEKWVENIKTLRSITQSSQCEKKEIEEGVNNKIASQPLIVSYKEHNEKKIHSALRNVITVRSEMNIKLLNKVFGEKVIVKVPKMLRDLVSPGELARGQFIIEGKTDNRICRREISRMIITSHFRYPIVTLSCRSFNIAISTQNVTTGMFISENTETNKNLLAIKYEQNESSLLEKEDAKVLEAAVKCEQKQEKYLQNCVPETEDFTTNSDDNSLDNDDDLFKSKLCPVTGKASLGSYIESIATLSTDVSIPSTEKLSIEKYSSTSSVGGSIQQINSKLYLNIKIASNLKVKKKPSSSNLKIISPYENNSLVVDEKKRKKILKIRERREKSRNALSKNKENSEQNLRLKTKFLLTGKSSDSNEKRKRIKKRKNKFTVVKDVQSYMENNKPFCSDSNSPIIINNFSQCLEPLVSPQDFKVELYSQEENINGKDVCILSKINQNIPPVNTPTESTQELSKLSLSRECKNSIDRLYSLIKELANPNDINVSKNEFTTDCSKNIYSDNNNKKKIEIIAHMPNVTLASKIQTVRSDKTVKVRRKEVDQHSDNTFKAISQLMHKFDNVQRLNNKIVTESKTPKNTRETLYAAKKNICETVMEAKKNIRETITEAKKNTCETVRETKKNTCDIIKETKRNSLVPLSSKTVKQEELKKVNTNNKVVWKSQGKISSTVKSQNIKLEPKSSEVIKEDNPNRIESTEVKASEEKSLGRTRLDVLAQPKKKYYPLSNRNRMPNMFPAAGTVLATTPQKNASSIPQRIKNVISINATLNKTPDFRSTRFPKASQRTQGETESRQPIRNSPERKRLSENKKLTQTKNDNVFNTSTVKKIVTHQNRAMSNLQLPSPKRKEFKTLQKPIITTIIAEQDKTTPRSKTEAVSLGYHNDEVTKNLVHVLMPAIANNEANALLGPLKPTNNSTIGSLNHSKSEEMVSGSDYKIDIFEDGNISTAVANTFARNIAVASARNIYKKHNFLKSVGRTCSLTVLEKALTAPVNSKSCEQPKFKDLSPKRSFQQIFVLQSGDAGSLVKSMLSNINSLRIMPKLSIQSFTKNNIDRASESLSFCYFSASNSMQYTIPVNLLNEMVQKSNDESPRKISTADNNTDNWHDDLDRVSNEANVKDGNKNNLFLEITEQSNKVSGLNDIADENCVCNTDSVLTSQTCDRTTSMDILLQLINEIKTISTYHANVSQEENLKTTTDGSIKDTMLRNFESNSSIHSFFTNNDNKCTQANEKYSIDSEFVEKTCMDKEVSACFDEREVITRCTDVPSQLLPVTTDRSYLASTTATSLNKTITIKENSIKNVKRAITETIIVDQHLKLKRDILVTVYSFLVLTVFVALTYPEIVARL